jgi:membrane-associated protein
MTAALSLPSQLAVDVLDAPSLLAAFGVIGVGVAMFAETGLLIGFFLPGDSLLFTAGLLCTGPADRAVRLSLGLLPLVVEEVARPRRAARHGGTTGPDEETHG